jgi:hypothetical protein
MRHCSACADCCCNENCFGELLAGRSGATSVFGMQFDAVRTWRCQSDRDCDALLLLYGQSSRGERCIIKRPKVFFSLQVRFHPASSGG